MQFLHSAGIHRDGRDDNRNDDDDIQTQSVELEPWTDWIKRTTHWAEAQVKQLKLENWLTQIWRRRWRWAAGIAKHEARRWTHRILVWQPEMTTGTSKVRTRKAGHPRKRWSDDITQFLLSKDFAIVHSNWWTLALHAESWSSVEKGFVEHKQDELHRVRSRRLGPTHPVQDGTGMTRPGWH
jgi:hypothetical protein